MAIDPVCGMQVSEDAAPAFEFEGTRYYFCCEGCKSSFAAAPDAYTS